RAAGKCLVCSKAGGVHFSEEPPSTGVPSHVHFDEKLHDSVVMVTQEDDGNFMVKVSVNPGKTRMEKYFVVPQRRNQQWSGATKTKYLSFQQQYDGHASISYRHHGTPMLLEGVRCIGVELEYDSEHSDWQGFD
uniref:Uncharacterized protein n=1 Tax=Oryzias sinensis TaxID=183150 RepID=A0A8C7XRF3_9TELE